MTLLPPPRCSHRALSSLRLRSASSAARFIPTTRDHCGWLRLLRINRRAEHLYRPSSKTFDSGNRHRLRVNRSSIVWLAARRQGIARFAALHLDCARSPGRGRYGFTQESFKPSCRDREFFYYLKNFYLNFIPFPPPQPNEGFQTLKRRKEILGCFTTTFY